MAITATNLAAAHDTTNRTSTAYTTASISFVAGRVYMLAVRGRVASGTPEVGSVTGGGNTWQLLQASNISNITLWLYYCVAGSTTSGTIDITPDGITTWTQAGWIVDEFVAYGVEQSAQNSNASSHSSLTVTLSGFVDATNNVAYGVFAHNEDTALTAGSGFTDLGATAEASENANRMKSIWKTGEDTSVDITSATTTADVFGVAAEIAEVEFVGPELLDVTTSFVSSTGSTTLTFDYPATVNSGDLLIAITCNGSSRTISSGPSGFTELAQDVSSSYRAAVWAKVADGTEDGGTFTLTLSTGGNGSCLVYRIGGFAGSIATDIDISSSAATTGSTINFPAVTAGWGSDDNLYLALAGAGSSATALTSGGTLANYTNHQYVVNSGTPKPQALGFNRRSTASSDDPGTTSNLGASFATIAWTVVIRPSDVVAANLVLSASAGASNSTLALSAPASLALSASDAVSGATAGVYSPALLAMASDGVGAATLGLRTTALLSMQSDGVGAASLGLRSPALLSVASDGASTAATAVTAPGGILIISSTDGLSTASAVVASPIFLSPSTSSGAATASAAIQSSALLVVVADGLSTASAVVDSPGVAFLALGQIDGVSSAANTITVPALLSLMADGTSTAAATVSTIAYLVPATIDGVATAALVVISPALLTMQADGVATASAVVFAPANVIISAIAGLSNATLAVKSPALLQLSADGLSATTIVVKSPALLSLTASGLASATALVRSPALMVIVADGTSLATISELSLGPSTKVRLGGAILLRPVLIQGGRQNVVRLGGGYSNPVRIPGGF